MTFRSCFDSDRWIFWWDNINRATAQSQIASSVLSLCYFKRILTRFSVQLPNSEYWYFVCMYVLFFIEICVSWLLLNLTDCCFFYDYKFTKNLVVSKSQSVCDQCIAFNEKQVFSGTVGNQILSWFVLQIVSNFVSISMIFD